MTEEKITLSDVLSCPRAAEQWGVNVETLKRYCRQGKFSTNEAVKLDKNWLITRQGMERLFGERSIGK